MKTAYALVLCVLAMTACIHTKIGPINTNRTIEIEVSNHATPPEIIDVYIVDNVGHWRLGQVKGGGTKKFTYQPTTPENLFHMWAKSSSGHNISIQSVDFTLVNLNGLSWDVRTDGNDMVHFY